MEGLCENLQADKGILYDPSAKVIGEDMKRSVALSLFQWVGNTEKKGSNSSILRMAYQNLGMF